jgi:hypothetical protein
MVFHIHCGPDKPILLVLESCEEVRHHQRLLPLANVVVLCPESVWKVPLGAASRIADRYEPAVTADTTDPPVTLRSFLRANDSNPTLRINSTLRIIRRNRIIHSRKLRDLLDMII